MLKKLVVFLALITLIGCFGGCVNKQPANENKEVVIFGFETDEDVHALRFTDAQESRKALNSDKTYVTEKDHSALVDLHVTEDYYLEYKEVTMQILAGRPRLEKSDFSDTVGICVDVYNAGNQDVELVMGYNNREIIIGYALLKPGANQVRLPYDPVQLFFANGASVRTIDFMIDARERHVTLYFDKLSVITKATTNFKAYNLESQTCNAEMYNFTNEAEAYSIFDQGGLDSFYSKFRTSINRDKDFIKNGDGSLKITFIEDRLTGYVCNKIRTYDGYNVEFYKYKNQDNYLMTDVYNGTDDVISVSMTVWYAVKDIYDTTLPRAYEIFLGEISPNSWSNPDSFKMAVDDIVEINPTNVITIMLAFGNVQNGDVVYVDNIRVGK